MARVTVEDCVDKVPNRFELVLLAAHRARAIADGGAITIAVNDDKNPVVALREIADDLSARLVSLFLVQPGGPDGSEGYRPFRRGNPYRSHPLWRDLVLFYEYFHGDTGAGDGMAQKFGLGTVQSLLQDRIRVMADGEIFDTITNGKNTMMGYGDRIQVPDRWAIIGYLRALQLSQGGATLDDVPADERAKLEATR